MLSFYLAAKINLAGTTIIGMKVLFEEWSEVCSEISSRTISLATILLLVI